MGVEMKSQNHDALKLEFSERSKPIIFWTGAGLSAPTIPSWTGLRDELLALLKENAKYLSGDALRRILAEHQQIQETDNIWLQFERLEKSLGREAFQQKIKSALSPSEKGDIPSAYSMLWKLTPSGVVTLNLDLFTQRASTSNQRGTPISIYPGKFMEHLNALKQRRPFIAYPHGHLDEPEGWTFTRAQLERRLSDPSYIEWLTLLFRATTVIFVGVTADDIAVGSPIEKITSQRIPLTGHFWITSRDDLGADEWAGANGVRLIRYQATNNNHAELLHLLNSLNGQIKQEDPRKEVPIISKSVGAAVAVLPTPKDLQNETDERKRQLLNARARSILENKDEATRDREYSDFLKEYDRAVFDSWYVSTNPGENKFLGYELIKQAEDGAFGTVYKGMDAQGNYVAVKLLKTENLRRPGFHKSFRRGANSLRILTERSVENVVTYVDAAEIPPTIIMTWSDGQSLDQLVQSALLRDWQERLEVARQLARVLRECHSLPERVLHRDLRPANVMVEGFHQPVQDWKIVVLDFDLSWHKGAEDHSIMHSPAFGYLAPEQRSRGRFTTRNALVDSYGFGMTLYFLCTGHNPFPDQHLNPNWQTELFRKFESQGFSDWISLPRRLARLVFHITQDDQPARYSMSQIEGELGALHAAVNTSGKIDAIEVITEELAARTAHFHGYRWSDTEDKATVANASGLNLELGVVDGQRQIRFSIRWASSGTQDWNHIDRMLLQALPKMENILRELDESVVLNKGRREFSVTAILDADETRNNVKGVATKLDKAISHATSIANF